MSRLISDARFSVAGGLGLLVLMSCVAGCGVPLAWDSREEVIEISSEGVQRLSLKTVNGTIRVRGSDDPDALIKVTAKIEGGASSQAEVQACLDAIEITISDVDEETPHISWQWRDDHRAGWSNRVSFEAIVPMRLGVVAETQNGAIDSTDAEGDCQLTSQNGRIRVLGGGSSTKAKTHNGGLFIQTTASDVLLATHNGEIEAVLKSPGPLGGKVESHNGSIQVAVNPRASTKVSARTKNGRIESKLTLDDEDRTRKTLEGKLGSGDGSLELSTHNGSITLRSASKDTPLPEETTAEDESRSSDEAFQGKEVPDEPEEAAVESDDEAAKGEDQPEDTAPPTEEDEKPAASDGEQTTADESAV